MKYKFNSEYVGEALLIISGIIITIFPSVISWLFYLAGALIIIWNISVFIFSMIKNIQCSVYKTILGFAMGIIVIALPEFLTFGIPLVIGSLILINGVERIFSSMQYKKSGKNWYITLALGIAFSLFGLYLIINPVRTTSTINRIIGITLLLLGVYRLLISLKESKSNGNKIDSVIDVDNFKVDD